MIAVRVDRMMQRATFYSGVTEMVPSVLDPLPDVEAPIDVLHVIDLAIVFNRSRHDLRRTNAALDNDRHSSLVSRSTLLGDRCLFPSS